MEAARAGFYLSGSQATITSSALAYALTAIIGGSLLVLPRRRTVRYLSLLVSIGFIYPCTSPDLSCRPYRGATRGAESCESQLRLLRVRQLCAGAQASPRVNEAVDRNDSGCSTSAIAEWHSMTISQVAWRSHIATGP